MIAAYTTYNGKICIAAPTVLDAGICSLPLWKKWCNQAKQLGYTTRPGGNGRPSLIELRAVPTQYREAIVAKYGNPENQFNALEEYYVPDAAARAFYDNYRLENGKALEPYQVAKYTTNASVLNALDKLKAAREFLTKRMGNPKRDLKTGLAADCIAFNEVLKSKHGGLQHTLPAHPRKLMEKLAAYKRLGYQCLIDGRAHNTNAQVVTPEMMELWTNIYAGQRHKPTHYEVHQKYNVFLLGKLEIINPETGEVYDPKADCYKQVSDRTVYNWLSEWKSRIATHGKRSGNRQQYMDKYIPFAQMQRPEYAGSIISVDDRQPPFKWGEGAGNRMWFYMGQDLASTAFVTWVWGETKEGLIIDFYRQMVRNHAQWRLSLPYELECEASLNSSFANTFLAPGAMFQKTRIIANMARSKRIERDFGTLRNGMESKLEEFVSRPHARAEHLQVKAGKQKFLSKDAIVEMELRMIEAWNNQLHPDQLKYPHLTRWDVFIQNQNPNLPPINWIALLPHLGYRTQSTMQLGRIMLQGKRRVVGYNGEVALGDTLLRVMNEVEGEDVIVYWLDDNEGNVIKSLVYNQSGRFICELLDDLPFNRAEIERTAQCHTNLQLTAAYRATVEGFAKQAAKRITPVEIIQKEIATNQRFVMPGLKKYTTVTEEAEILPPPNESDDEVVYIPKTNNTLYNNF